MNLQVEDRRRRSQRLPGAVEVLGCFEDEEVLVLLNVVGFFGRVDGVLLFCRHGKLIVNP